MRHGYPPLNANLEFQSCWDIIIVFIMFIIIIIIIIIIHFGLNVWTIQQQSLIKVHQLSLVITLIDLKNAFDEVHHQFLRKTVIS